MKFYTGDESGLVKMVIPPAEVEDEAIRRKRARKSDDLANKEGPQPAIQVFGKVDKTKAVQKMQWGKLDGKKQIVVARRNGQVDFMCPETGNIVRTYQDETVGAENDQATFVGLHSTESHLMTCTSMGRVSYTSLSSYSASNPNPTTCISEKLGTNLSIMRVHPLQSHLFAIGGKDRENDLQIFDANVLSTSSTETHGEEKAKMTKFEKKKAKAKGLLFQAKNVPRDMLDLDAPIHIRDLQFMNEEGTKIATATHYHQIRLYDTKAQRRPVHDWNIGELPLTFLRIGRDYNEVIYADTQTNTGIVDIRTGKTLMQFKGFMGAVTDVQIVPQATFSSSSSSSSESQDCKIASVSMDRFLRVHEMSTKFRKMEHKIYLKQRMTSILADEDYKVPEEENKDEEEEAMWEAMEKVEDHGKRKRQ